jgi:N-acyl homoserine lactone hydrolase
MRAHERIVWLPMLSLVFALLVIGCDRARPVPRIDPELRNWPESYHGLEGLRIHVFQTGTITLPEAAVFRGGSWFARRRMDVPAFVIEHPSAGLIAFDTGLSPRSDALWLAELGMVHTWPEADLASQMKKAGLDIDRVRYVVVSHLHFDHTGDLGSFPNASIVSACGEQQEAARSGAMGFYRSADWDGAGRWIEIDYGAGAPLGTFSSHHDLLGDGSVVLVDLHGHTNGSQGLLLRAPGGPVLLTGDAAWVDENWRYAATPIWADDMDAWWDQIWRIKKLVDRVPSLLVVAGHDLSRIRGATRDDITVHRFQAPSE